MIDPAPSRTVEKLVLGKRSSRLKNRTKRGNSDIPRFQYKITVLFNLELKMFF